MASMTRPGSFEEARAPAAPQALARLGGALGSNTGMSKSASKGEWGCLMDSG